jgi:hypothetical protein
LGQIVRNGAGNVHMFLLRLASACPEGKYLAIPWVLYFAIQPRVRPLATYTRSMPQGSDFCSAYPDPSVADRVSAHIRLLAGRQL